MKVPYEKLQKFGKQWVVTKAAMIREYGEPKARNKPRFSFEKQNFFVKTVDLYTYVCYNVDSERGEQHEQETKKGLEPREIFELVIKAIVAKRRTDNSAQILKHSTHRAKAQVPLGAFLLYNRMEEISND